MSHTSASLEEILHRTIQLSLSRFQYTPHVRAVLQERWKRFVSTKYVTYIHSHVHVLFHFLLCKHYF